METENMSADVSDDDDVEFDINGIDADELRAAVREARRAVDSAGITLESIADALNEKDRDFDYFEQVGEAKFALQRAIDDLEGSI